MPSATIGHTWRLRDNMKDTARIRAGHVKARAGMLHTHLLPLEAANSQLTNLSVCAGCVATLCILLLLQMMQCTGKAEGGAVEVSTADVKRKQELAGENKLAAPAGQSIAADGQHILHRAEVTSVLGTRSHTAATESSVARFDELKVSQPILLGAQYADQPHITSRVDILCLEESKVMSWCRLAAVPFIETLMQCGHDRYVAIVLHFSPTVTSI